MPSPAMRSTSSRPRFDSGPPPSGSAAQSAKGLRRFQVRETMRKPSSQKTSMSVVSYPSASAPSIDSRQTDPLTPLHGIEVCFRANSDDMLAVLADRTLESRYLQDIAAEDELR